MLEYALFAYAETDAYPFHMPGHKRRPGEFGSSFLGKSFAPASIDITEIEGFDDLHDARGIIRAEMERAAALYGTRQTFFSVNGSTCSNLAAVSAAVPKGGSVLIGPAPHRSIPHAAFLRDLEAVSLPCEECCPGIPGPVRPELVGEAFRRRAAEGKRRFDAVVITSPTYEGIVSDVRAIAEITHQNGAVLIVDEAHGAHLPFHPSFPESALRQGADLVTHSLHKTLPSLTQTSLLHRVTDRVSGERIDEWLDIYETSSPSYLLMASITACLHALESSGREAFDRYTEALRGLRDELKGLSHLRLLDHPSADPSKLVITCGACRLTGQELMRILREDYRLELERCGPSHVLAMTSVCDTPEGFARLADALCRIDRDV